MREWINFRRKISYWSLVESVLITMVVLTLAFIFRPQDPFFLYSAFPWIWFVPVLMALAYGFIPSIISVILLAIFFDYQATIQQITSNQERIYLLGGFLLTILCAEFQSIWRHRIRRAQTYSDYASDTIENLSKSYYTMLLSHDKLERYLINKPSTLRGAFQELRQLMDKKKNRLSPQLALSFLQLLGYYCSINRMGFYLYQGNKIVKTPLAALGEVDELNTSDPLIKMALEDKKLLYYDVKSLKDREQSQYLLTTPLINSSNELLGLLVIIDMPFITYNYETFQVISVLSGYFANSFITMKLTRELRDQFPKIPTDFAEALIKLKNVEQHTNINSCLMAVYFHPHPQRPQIVESFIQAQRGNDYLWQHENKRIMIIFLLMPFTNNTATQGYISRMQQWLHNQHGFFFGQPPVNYKYTLIEADEPATLLTSLMDYTSE